eukprot:14183720-Alexandrium_andersonii.AAC.1
MVTSPTTAVSTLKQSWLPKATRDSTLSQEMNRLANLVGSGVGGVGKLPATIAELEKASDSEKKVGPPPLEPPPLPAPP